MNQSASQSVTINRTLVGAVTLVMLGGAGVLWFVAGSQDMWTGACLKVGLVTGALWLALPTISRRDQWGRTSWMAVAGAMATALVLARIRVDIRLLLPLLLGIGVSVMVLRPRRK